ncbi:MAG TPA: NAD(P)/FAD-dependent oxidoreductase [Pyrinomonadaceae bacterium]
MSEEKSKFDYPKSKIAIVGSGFLGLTLALRLAETGAKVTVYESAPEIGGLAGAWQIGDVVWDKHYHVTLLSDSFTRKIVGELGLENEFEWVETKTGFYTDGKLVSMSNSLEFLKFPPLDLMSKFRLGATIFYASRVKDWKALEKISVEDWLVKLSGRRTFEKMWKPLLKAKLGEAYRETSAAFIWATIQRMYAARNSGLKKEMFGYVRGGYARVLKRFGEVLREKGVEIRLNSKIEKIEKLDSGKLEIFNAAARRRGDLKAEIYPQINTDGHRFEYRGETTTISEPTAAASAFSRDRRPKTEDHFDEVILTCPSSVAAKIVPQLTGAERAKLENIKYQGIVCASVLMKNSLSRFYVTNITDETPFTGIIEMSALVDKSEFGANALVYLPKYAAPDDELFDKSDAEIEETFLSELERMYSHFRREDVLAFKVSRVRQVFPIPTVSYSENLPGVKTSLENVFIVNSAQITNGTLNVNETVQLAEKFFATEFAENTEERKFEITDKHR